MPKSWHLTKTRQRSRAIWLFLQFEISLAGPTECSGFRHQKSSILQITVIRNGPTIRRNCYLMLLQTLRENNDANRSCANNKLKHNRKSSTVQAFTAHV